MVTTKSYFIQQANRYGILHVRERNSEDDLTGWGALQFLLNNGELFVLSGYQFGQGPGEEGLWFEVHGLTKQAFNELKRTLPSREEVKIDDIEKSQVEDYLSHHLNEDTLKDII